MITPSLFPGTSPTTALFLASNTLSDIAFKSARAAATDPDSNIVALLFSAAWFEGSLNEAIHDLLEGRHREQSVRLTRIALAAREAGLGDRMARTERKLRVLCASATDVALDDSAAPWRDVLLLFRLRNWTVHLRPETLKVRLGQEDEPSSLVSTQVHELVTDLLHVGAIAEIPAGRMVPVALAARLGGVGPWAYKAAYAGLVTLDTWLPERYRRLVEAHHPPEQLNVAG